LSQVIACVERGEDVAARSSERNGCRYSWLELVPSPSPRRAAVMSFPAYVVVAADVDRSWLESWMGAGDYAAPIGPPFLGALEERLRVAAGNLDVLTLGSSLPGPPPIDLTPVPGSSHSRVARAHRYRTDVQAWTSAHGILVLGRGVGGRWEAAFEVDEAARGKGHGRALAAAARHLVPDGRPVWAQCSPGNASSLRALLAAGYQPVGSEVLLIPPTR
jgi:GNAT superfamily N-acetyltransferase